MSAIFISDVHLQDATSVKTQVVTRFFQEKASQFNQIFILGDLFDVWPGTTNYLIQKFKPVTQVLGNLVKQGHEVFYIEGNHDFRLGSYFSSELGVKVFASEICVHFGAVRAFLTHGDLANPKEKGYRFLRAFLRQDLLHLAIKPIPEKWIFDLGANTSKLSRSYQVMQRKPDEASKIRQIYRAAAEEIFHRGYDLVVMGHTHLPDDVSITLNGKKHRYINTGDWVSHFTYLEFDGSEFYTRTHPMFR